MIFGLHRAAPRGLNLAGHGISHLQFFSPINVFFGLKSKTGKFRPKATLFHLYLLEPERPRAEITSLPSPNIGQLLTQKWSGSATSFIPMGLHIYCTFFLVTQKKRPN